jgi:glutathionylspermidine synthase
VSDYLELAARLRATGTISDPWIDGQPRFEAEPVVLAPAEAEALAAASEDVVALVNELCRRVAAEPALLDALGLTPWQRLMWHSSAPHWHGIARADAFFTAGPGEVQICELNCDTPSGEAEAVILNDLVGAARPGLRDPNRGLGSRLVALVEAVAATLPGPGGRPLGIGIVYPTELTEDLSMVHLYRQLFEARGWRVALGSPYNLAPSPGGRLSLLGEPADVLIRHYKTDWWGERESVWLDEPPPNDEAPLDGPLALVTSAVLRGTCALVNPLGAVVPQNKRSFALLWELASSLPAWADATLRRHVPETLRLETLPVERLAAERDDWVLKSDYGCEGDEVFVGADVDDATWREVLIQARPGRWVAQRRFAPRPGRAAVVNHGVYIVAGRAAGILTRLSPGKTDPRARTVATLIGSEREGAS